MANAGTGAAPTLAYLRYKTGNQWTTKKEIYNKKVVARREFLDGRSPIQALYDEIRAGDFIFNVMVSSDGALQLNAKIKSEKSNLAHRHAVKFMKPLVKKLLDLYNNSIDMDDGDECTGLFRTSFGVPCRHEIKRRIKENGRFYIGDIHRQWHLVAPPVVQPVAVAAEPCSSPRKSLMRTLEKRLYEADDDHVAVVMARLDEASQAPLQSLSNPVVVTRKSGPPAGSTNNKANQRENSLF
ncbi:hypothetical protein PsorP6_011291 [Peronosclerospora sorghi]|uniref:Uncharacterized protein n=1 Tax=Peronosclerospora sorghi TaxID=230839 RepID=A0ACC0WJZ8_9STRA|nr:hypothetical protein PsorP6_011291 [Peronosclerospora sorghi]